ncbi:NADP-dependent oxidoreductase domain-containing protein, partial [Catenaria anguillulae PL171]
MQVYTTLIHPRPIMTAQPTLTLSTGREIPALAFGTGTKWFKRGDSASSTDLNRELIDIIKAALANGIRHIDTAEVYNTEGEVGVALEEYLAENPQVKRQDLYITSKVFPGLGDLRGTLERGLKLAKTEYFDLYLIHAPFLEQVKNINNKTLADLWAELVQAQSDGLVRDIGVSNFDPHHIDALGTNVPLPVVNQIEFHPLLPQPKLRADH